MFVLVACPENTMIDSKNYYRPVITPFELEVALERLRFSFFPFLVVYYCY